MQDITKNVLAKELDYYQRNRQNFLKTYKGKFIAIKDKKFIGSFSSEAESYASGVEKVGTEPFLVKKVTEEDQTENIPALSAGAMNVNL